MEQIRLGAQAGKEIRHQGKLGKINRASKRFNWIGGCAFLGAAFAFTQFDSAHRSRSLRFEASEFYMPILMYAVIGGVIGFVIASLVVGKSE